MMRAIGKNYNNIKHLTIMKKNYKEPKMKPVQLNTAELLAQSPGVQNPKLQDGKLGIESLSVDDDNALNGDVWSVSNN